MFQYTHTHQLTVLGPLQKEQFSKVNVHAMNFFCLGQKITSIDNLFFKWNFLKFFFLGFVMIKFLKFKKKKNSLMFVHYIKNFEKRKKNKNKIPVCCVCAWL